MTISTTLRRRRCMALLGAVAWLVMACATGAVTPAPTICDSISSEAGGCAPDRHVFAGSTCDDLAREWAAVIDERVVAIIGGPSGVGGEARSVRLKQAVVIATIDVNRRMRELDIQARCDADAFLELASAQLSPALKTGVGAAMYDGDPVVGYDDWLTDVERSVRMIDQEE